MRIDLGEKYYMNIDSLNVALFRIQETDKKNARTKNDTTERLIDYYSNIQEAIKSAIKDNRIRETDPTDFEKYFEDIKEYDSKLMNEIKESYKAWRAEIHSTHRQACGIDGSF